MQYKGMLRTVVVWLLAALALAGMLVLAVLVLGFALIAVPVVLLAAGWLAHRQRPARRGRAAGPAVYEGEFQVLEEAPDRPR